MFSTLMLAAMLAQSGKPVSAEEIRAIDLTVFPNGSGLPRGKGTAVRGAALYKEKCAECHNEKGEGREQQYPRLVGGIGSLATAEPVKTVGSYWPHATTVFDYIRRAMPYETPRSLSADEVYSITAVLLYWNGIIGENDELNEKTLPRVKMPNREGFVPDSRPHQKTKR
ncbi:MAG: cytochrome c [Bryobacter sp.]|jgi:cytochrome c|nr:cytochrome c [Bryobacter sp. CoA8 C33]